MSLIKQQVGPVGLKSQQFKIRNISRVRHYLIAYVYTDDISHISKFYVFEGYLLWVINTIDFFYFFWITDIFNLIFFYLNGFFTNFLNIRFDQTPDRKSSIYIQCFSICIYTCNHGVRVQCDICRQNQINFKFLTSIFEVYSISYKE